MTSQGGDTSRTPEGADGICARLRAFMQMHDLALEELADLLGIHRQTLTEWLSGKSTPPAIALPVLARLPQARAYPADSEEALKRVQAI